MTHISYIRRGGLGVRDAEYEYFVLNYSLIVYSSAQSWKTLGCLVQYMSTVKEMEIDVSQT